MYQFKLSDRQMNDLFYLREELKREEKKATIIGLVREAVDNLLVTKQQRKEVEKNERI